MSVFLAVWKFRFLLLPTSSNGAVHSLFDQRSRTTEEELRYADGFTFYVLLCVFRFPYTTFAIFLQIFEDKLYKIYQNFEYLITGHYQGLEVIRTR